MKSVVQTILFSLLATTAGAIAPVQKGDGVALTKERLKLVLKGAEEFQNDCGYYPKSIFGLVVDIDGCENWGPEPYVKLSESLSDAWSRPFIYTRESKKIKIKSLGPVETDKNSPRGEIVIEN